MKLWKYNKTTGLWNYVRSVTEDTKDQWLNIFQKDEPSEYFKIATRKPKQVMR